MEVNEIVEAVNCIEDIKFTLIDSTEIMNVEELEIEELKC